jgi:hypothetical protein
MMHGVLFERDPNVTLGKIEDLVVDIDMGRIVSAVLESGGFLSIGDLVYYDLPVLLGLVKADSGQKEQR